MRFLYHGKLSKPLGMEASLGKLDESPLNECQSH